MNERHKRFCLLVFEGMPAWKAYQEAGYKANRHAAETSSSRLMSKAEIINHLAMLGGKVVAAAVDRVVGFKVDRTWVMDRLVENVQRCMQAVPVLDAEGNPSGNWTWNAAAANKALELLGTEIGMFVAKSEVDSMIRIVTDKPMSRDEWARKYAVNPPPLTINGSTNGSGNGEDH